VSGEPFHVLVFEVGGRRFGLPAHDVQQLLRAAALTPLPRAPAIVKGIINLRGRAVPVLDVRGRFGLASKPLAPSDHFVVARAGERLVVLHVDRALELVQLDAAEVEDARGVVPGAEYVAWIARRGSDLVLIHDLQTFLSKAEADDLDAALSQPALTAEKGAGR
jgi:purine-binding chemotaxis protein CheW